MDCFSVSSTFSFLNVTSLSPTQVWIYSSICQYLDRKGFCCMMLCIEQTCFTTLAELQGFKLARAFAFVARPSNQVNSLGKMLVLFHMKILLHIFQKEKEKEDQIFIYFSVSTSTVTKKSNLLDWCHALAKFTPYYWIRNYGSTDNQIFLMSKLGILAIYWKRKFETLPTV